MTSSLDPSSLWLRSLVALPLSLALSCASLAPHFGAPRAAIGDWGVDTSLLSETVDPGDDFYTYVNEGWQETAEIPQGFSATGSFRELRLATEERVRAIIADAGDPGAVAGTPEQQIGALHRSYLDTGRLETLGLDPIREELDRLLATTSREEIARWMGRPRHTSLAGVWIGLDPGDPTQYVARMYQAGLAMPNRDYYLKQEEPFPGHREAYLRYLEGLFERAGIDRSEERARAVLDLEIEIARRHWTPAEARDRLRNYHPIERRELAEFAPGFDWDAFLDELGLADADRMIVSTDTAIQGLAELGAETPVDVLVSYLAAHFLSGNAPLLSSEWEDAHFDFFSRRLEGIDEPRARELRAVQTVDRWLEEQVGQIYVERHFPPEYRSRMAELVEYLRRAFRERLHDLDWMDDETRKEALAKLEAFIPKVGYPERWHDMSDLRVDAGDLVGNRLRIVEWEWKESLARLEGPRRDWEWGMPPQMVNAYYHPTRNEIVFPAAILQAPFFDPGADPAVNFGGIGAVIGHEMGHGFDDQGSRSDGSGLLRDWWTDASRSNFEERTSRLVAQYAAFSPIEGMNVNGELTLGENIGDLGGIAIALHAYRLYVEDHYGGEAPEIDGFSGEQRLFMAWAQVWRTLRTDEYLQRQLLTDPHSPGEYRSNGPVRNIDAWYEAFGVTPDRELYLPPEERVRIW